jgi:hypothetical protein
MFTWTHIPTTYRGRPALWEGGGGRTNTGHAVVVAGAKGERLAPLYVRTHGHLACGDHALLPVQNGFHVVRVSRWGEDVRIVVDRVLELHPDMEGGWEARSLPVGLYEDGRWGPLLPEGLEEPVIAAVEKTRCYRCRSPHYVLEGEKGAQ